MKITKKTDIHGLLMKKPELAELLFQSGMGCVGCPMSMGETLEEGCKVHGMSDKEIDKLIDKMNRKMGFFKKEPTMVESKGKKGGKRK